MRIMSEKRFNMELAKAVAEDRKHTELAREFERIHLEISEIRDKIINLECSVYTKREVND